MGGFTLSKVTSVKEINHVSIPQDQDVTQVAKDLESGTSPLVGGESSKNRKYKIPRSSAEKEYTSIGPDYKPPSLHSGYSSVSYEDAEPPRVYGEKIAMDDMSIVI